MGANIARNAGQQLLLACITRYRWPLRVFGVVGGYPRKRGVSIMMFSGASAQDTCAYSY